MSDDNVKVLVRCRPLNSREKGLNCKTVVCGCAVCVCVYLHVPRGF